MKTKIIYLIAILISCMLMSSVCAVPNIKLENDFNKSIKIMNSILNNTNIKLLNKFKNMVINKIGIDNYTNLNNEIKFMIYHTCVYDKENNTIITNIDDYNFKIYLDYLDWMIEFLTILVAIITFFIGHNIFSFALYSIIAFIVLFIPLSISCFGEALIVSVIDTFQLVGQILDFEELFNNYGVLGLLLALFLFLPIIIIVFIIVYPFMFVLSFTECMASLLWWINEIWNTGYLNELSKM